jgi:hypothetical protein
MHRNRFFAIAQGLRGYRGAQIRQAGVEERVCANFVKNSKVWLYQSGRSNLSKAEDDMPRTGAQIEADIEPLFKRYNEGLKVLGTGNGAGTLAMIAALHTFADHAALLPWLKITAVVFAIGVILFAVAYFAFITAHIFIGEYTIKLDDQGTSPATMKAHDAAIGGLYVAAISALISTGCFFVGAGLAFIALLKF